MIESWRSSKALILAAAVALGSVGLATQANAESKIVDAKIMKAKGAYGLFNTYKVQPSFYAMSMVDRSNAAAAVQALVEKHKGKVMVQAYLTRGFESDSDFLLRLHAYEPDKAQAFLVDFKATIIGRHSEVKETLIGVTKGLNHTTKKKAPDLLASLKAGKYEGGTPKYAFMIPIKKNAAWWNLSEKEKLDKMIEHTMPTLAFLSKVKRKLYHSTGLDDMDFITFFETNDLVAFNNLNIELFKVSENLFNVRYGKPIVMGTIASVSDVFNALAK